MSRAIACRILTGCAACAAVFSCAGPPAPESERGSTAAAGDGAHQPALAPDVLRRLKAATVFVQVGGDAAAGEGSGSGFFISPDGRAVTSWHVVAPPRRVGDHRLAVPPASLQLILRSGARDQTVLPARLLAVDAESDLALLKAEVEGCAWLPLGDAEPLVETAPLWVAGFPLGRLFSVLQRGPEISVNFGHVASLRHDDRGRLERIQFDAAVVPGNSGGPVIAPDGRVLGVACAAIGASRVNFAAPAGPLRRLLAECPLDRPVGPACALGVVSEPPGADVYLDSAPIGKTPLQTRADGGYRRLVVALPGRRAWARALSLYDGRRIEAALEPFLVAPLKAAPQDARPAGDGTAMARGELLFAERFADPDAAEAWDQDVGGTSRRSWYVQDGELRQFSDDGALHAAFAGHAVWDDCAFSATVRIADNGKDGRAGLILRQTEDGFTLFRIHRETAKVQLARHATRPFGWQVCEERTLPFRVEANRSYRLEVQALADRVVGLVDGRVVLEARVHQPARGRVGFYSVDSQAAFRDAELRRLAAGERPPAREATLRSFWFTDPFQDDHGYWQAWAGDAPAPPWDFFHGGCRPPGPGVADARNVLARYDLYDMTAACVVRCTSGSVGLTFRLDGPRGYALAADPGAGKIRLLALDGAKRRELASADLPAAPRAPPDRPPGAGEEGDEPVGPGRAQDAERLLVLSVIARGDRLLAAVNGEPCLDVTDATSRHGRLGLYADKASACFHRLDANSGPP